MFTAKLRLQNDVQTERRPRPPPGNTVITIITYRALILISPSYVPLSLSLFLTRFAYSFATWKTPFLRPFTRTNKYGFIRARERSNLVMRNGRHHYHPCLKEKKIIYSLTTSRDPSRFKRRKFACKDLLNFNFLNFVPLSLRGAHEGGRKVCHTHIVDVCNISLKI